MSYLVFIDLMARATYIVLAIYFIFILAFGDSRYKAHSFLLVTYSFIYFLMPELNVESTTYRNDYLLQVNASMLIEGAAGLAMICILLFDRLARYHALILAFAVTCHFMVYCDIQGDPKWILTIASGFYVFYDELIILVGVMQMAVSYNGFTTASINTPRKLQGVISWFYVCNNNLRKCLSKRKKRETKA